MEEFVFCMMDCNAILVLGRDSIEINEILELFWDSCLLRLFFLAFLDMNKRRRAEFFS